MVPLPLALLYAVLFFPPQGMFVWAFNGVGLGLLLPNAQVRAFTVTACAVSPALGRVTTRPMPLRPARLPLPLFRVSLLTTSQH